MARTAQRKQHIAHPEENIGQGAFAAALTNVEVDIPQGLVTPDGRPATRRFGIYRNNVIVSLTEALTEIFPTVRNLVGEEFFRAMARLYIEAEPPRSRLLFEYGETFATFIEGFEHTADLPFLADVARIERSWLDSFHAADTTPMTSEALSNVPPEELGELCFVAHPATRIIVSRYSAISIVARDRAGATLDDIDPFEPEAGLITRQEFDPQMRHLPLASAQFARMLLDGETLGTAAQSAFSQDASFDLPGTLSALLQAGAFTAAKLKNNRGN